MSTLASPLPFALGENTKRGVWGTQKWIVEDLARRKNHLTDLLESLIEAVYLPAAEKKPLLQKLNIRLEKIRYLFRLGFELGLYTSLRYNEFARRVDEIGRMTGGWIKSLQ